MNKIQSNKMRAYQAISGVLEKHHRTCAEYPILVQAVEEFHSLKEEIGKVAAARESDTTGETLAKNEARKKLARHASKVAGLGMAYAFDHSDKELEAALNYSYSEIYFVRDAEAIEISGAIYETLNRDLPGLEKYLVSRNELEELARLRDGFQDAMTARGAVKSRRVADTRALAELFRSCDLLLSHKIDRLMLSMEDEHQQFHDAYFNARKIKDL